MDVAAGVNTYIYLIEDDFYDNVKAKGLFKGKCENYLELPNFIKDKAIAKRCVIAIVTFLTSTYVSHKLPSSTHSSLKAANSSLGSSLVGSLG